MAAAGAGHVLLSLLHVRVKGVVDALEGIALLHHCLKAVVVQRGHPSCRLFFAVWVEEELWQRRALTRRRIPSNLHGTQANGEVRPGLAWQKELHPP